MGFGFNAVTGDYSQGAGGFWIENGELAFPVTEITVSANFDALWKRVDAVGDDSTALLGRVPDLPRRRDDDRRQLTRDYGTPRNVAEAPIMVNVPDNAGANCGGGPLGTFPESRSLSARDRDDASRSCRSGQAQRAAERRPAFQNRSGR